MDKLISAAKFYNNDVLMLEYRIIVARKGRLFHIVITFEKNDFWHMIGGSAINDAPQFKTDRSVIFQSIVSNDESFSKVINSHEKFQSDLYQNRRKDFMHIVNALDNENTMFRVTENMDHSKIKADFIIECNINKKNYWIFLRDRSKRKNKNLPNDYSKYVVVSSFSDDKYYSVHQTLFKTLYKAKKNTESDELIEIKRSDSLDNLEISKFDLI